ncbi:MAG: YecA family protein [Cecembia sp.]
MKNNQEKRRDEKSIFKDLEKITSEKGYLYVIITFCLRDNLIKYRKQISKKEILQQFNPKRLVRTEISTLIGLTFKNPISFELPPENELQSLIKKTEELLVELHYAILLNSNKADYSKYNFSLPSIENRIREAVFYSGEGAYNFQYKEFTKSKFRNDNRYFVENFGFSVEQMLNVFEAVEKIQISNLNKSNKSKKITAESLLSYFKFTTEEVSRISKVNEDITNKIIDKFTCASTDLRRIFNSLGDFNPYNAFPFIKIELNVFFCFQVYSLYEALYESPVFFLNEDKNYRKIAAKNRGEFTEKFAFNKLVSVFGEKKVYTGIELMLNKNSIISEIDVLVLFGEIAIIVQAKSKKLTIESRKGNISTIEKDFKLAIQDAYDQAFLSGKSLLNSKIWLRDAEKTEIALNQKPKIIYPIILLSDYYPSLSMQVKEFLKTQSFEGMMNPFISDIFTLDAICEFLKSPLYFLSYLDRRVLYFNEILAVHELTILSSHLTNNLWIDNNYSAVYLTDDIGAELDAAMIVRRENLQGQRTPAGILTKFKNTHFHNIISQLEYGESIQQVELGLFLLKLSEESVINLNTQLDKIFRMTLEDKGVHDITLIFNELSSGLTIHTSFSNKIEASELLEMHCVARKYKCKLDKWFGLFLNPLTQQLQMINYINSKWTYSKELESFCENLDHISDSENTMTKKSNLLSGKVGRNELCPCGSGKKFKKCCI